ncbi:hypothetical protein RMN64_00825 [Plesiomonas shigelloides]|uniref:hypothetical protein n=1 Tax=Plesiomonas shigelloides TaxID=703 RepID=UPI00288582BD|nr:hypothetical protein [Plesiomonas shigelloides]MDT1010004.1 hypothetical protein [Plesiomonas shigelloides]
MGYIKYVCYRVIAEAIMRITSGHRLTTTRASKVVAADAINMRSVILPSPRVERLGAVNLPVAAVRAIPALMPSDDHPVPMQLEDAVRVCEGEWLPAGCADTGYAQHGQPSAIQHYQQMLALARTGGRRWTPSIDERV